MAAGLGRALATWISLTMAGPRKEGMCVHPEEEELRANVNTWLAAWRCFREAPSAVNARWWKPRSAPAQPRPYAFRKVGGRNMTGEPDTTCSLPFAWSEPWTPEKYGGAPREACPDCGLRKLPGQGCGYCSAPTTIEEPLEGGELRREGEACQSVKRVHFDEEFLQRDSEGKARRPPRSPRELKNLRRADSATPYVVIPDGGMDRLLQVPGALPRGVGPGAQPETFEDMKLRLLLGSIVPSTHRNYTLAWEQWRLFCKLRGQSPVLAGGGPGRKASGRRTASGLRGAHRRQFGASRQHGEVQDDGHQVQACAGRVGGLPQR